MPADPLLAAAEAVLAEFDAYGSVLKKELGDDALMESLRRAIEAKKALPEDPAFRVEVTHGSTGPAEFVPIRGGATEAPRNTIRLPRSGVEMVGSAFVRGGDPYRWDGPAKSSLRRFGAHWSASFLGENAPIFPDAASREKCIAWLDERVLELRSALAPLPEGAREKCSTCGGGGRDVGFACDGSHCLSDTLANGCYCPKPPCEACSGTGLAALRAGDGAGKKENGRG